jgi:hypothetical protein
MSMNADRAEKPLDRLVTVAPARIEKSSRRRIGSVPEHW